MVPKSWSPKCQISLDISPFSWLSWQHPSFLRQFVAGKLVGSAEEVDDARKTAQNRSKTTEHLGLHLGLLQI